MQITVLVENTTKDKSKLVPEHGLSIYITYCGQAYLLDSGSTGVFADNAQALNISLRDVKTGILSHGHYDHAGGFARFFVLNKEACIYAMHTADRSYYSNSGGYMHEIGIPKDVLKHRERFVFIKEMQCISEGVYLLSHTTHKLNEISRRAGLFRKCNDAYLPDNFSHELTLVFDTKQGLVIFNSCSHAGIRSIIREVNAVFPDKAVYAFIGGLHMKGKKNDGTEICAFSEKEIQDIAEYIQDKGIQRVYTGHCTGLQGFETLKKYLGDKLQYLGTGMRIEIGER